jgi:hypothetical protein
VITDCSCSYRGILELNELTFLVDTLALHVFAVPAVVGFILWRMFITNRVGPRGGITVLGLDDSSSIYSELGQCRLSHYVRFEYVLVAVFTFAFGLLMSEVWKSLFVLFIGPAETEFLRH